jgi:hypothetical protein
MQTPPDFSPVPRGFHEFIKSRHVMHTRQKAAQAPSRFSVEHPHVTARTLRGEMPKETLAHVKTQERDWMLKDIQDDQAEREDLVAHLHTLLLGLPGSAQDRVVHCLGRHAAALRKRNGSALKLQSTAMEVSEEWRDLEQKLAFHEKTKPRESDVTTWVEFVKSQ